MRIPHSQVAYFLLTRGRMLTELRAGLCLISCSLALVLPGPAAAIQRATPQSIRVTSGATHVHSTGRSWGRYFAFASPVDLTDQGSTAAQAYVFSVVNYACQFGRPELQIPSEEPVTCPNPNLPYLVKATNGTTADNIANPSVNSTGTIVAFEAFGSYEGLCSGAARSRRQVFVRDLTLGKTTAVTCETDGDSYGASLNDAGGAVVFTSTASTLSASPAGIPQVYVYQYSSPEPRPGLGQITPISYGQFALGKGPSGAPMLNKLGTHVVFESRANLLGDGSDTAVWNIFWFDRQLGRIFQVTSGNGDSRNPYVEEKRPGSVYFDSTATDLPGTDGLPGGRQVYRANIISGDFPAIEQWTFGPGNSWGPAAEPNGQKLVFLSDGDLLANGTTGPRIFGYDFRNATRVLYQITGRGNVGGRLGASLGAWFVTFDSDDDVGGYGVCGRQIWLTTFDPDHYTEAGHVRIASATPGLRPTEPAPGNRNDSCDDANGCTVDTCIGGQTCAFAQRPDGFVCGEGNQCDDGVATCAAGECVRQSAIACDDSNACTDDTCDPQTGCANVDVVCDDNNPCTDDSCDEATGCAYVPRPAMEGVACVNDNVAPPSQGNKQVLKNLRRAQKLVDQAQRKGPKGQKRKLKQAEKLFKDVLPDISNDEQIPRAQRIELVEKLYGLLEQIGKVLNDLQNQTKKGSK